MPSRYISRSRSGHGSITGRTGLRSDGGPASSLLAATPSRNCPRGNVDNSATSISVDFGDVLGLWVDHSRYLCPDSSGLGIGFSCLRAGYPKWCSEFRIRTARESLLSAAGPGDGSAGQLADRDLDPESVASRPSGPSTFLWTVGVFRRTRARTPSFIRASGP